MRSLLNVSQHLLLQGMFSCLLQIEVFLLSGQIAVVYLVNKELVGMLIVRNQFEVTVELIHHSAFLSKKRTPPCLIRSTGVSQRRGRRKKVLKLKMNAS
jgi:hypothetical protein